MNGFGDGNFKVVVNESVTNDYYIDVTIDVQTNEEYLEVTFSKNNQTTVIPVSNITISDQNSNYVVGVVKPNFRVGIQKPACIENHRLNNFTFKKIEKR